MSFESVLDLTPYQIAALLTEKSTPPGEADPDVYRRVLNAHYRTLADRTSDNPG